MLQNDFVWGWLTMTGEKRIRKFRTKYKVLLIICTAIFFIVNIFGFYLGNMYYQKICNLYIDRANTGLTYYRSSFDYTRYETLETYEVNIKSNFGYKLTGTYIFNSKPTKNTIIIVHGISGDHWESMRYADMYLDLGFNVLVYDSRDHGTSGGKDITLGFFEKYDLENVVKWCKLVNQGGVIGVHGESLGAVTALLEANLDQADRNVSFYVSDCAYSDLPELLDIKLSGSDRPHFVPEANFILFYGNLIALNRSGFSFYAVSPISAIKNIKTPVMFIHGSNDTFIPASMSLDMYLAKKGPKFIYIAPNAEHALSYFTDTVEYKAKILQFLTDNKIIKNGVFTNVDK